MPKPETTRNISTAELLAAAELRKALRRFQSDSSRIVREHGLTNERYELLLAVNAAEHAGNPVTTGDLSVEMQLAHSSLTQLVRRTHQAGLITRKVSERDARVRYLVLTELGRLRLASAAAQLTPERDRLVHMVRTLEAVRT